MNRSNRHRAAVLIGALLFASTHANAQPKEADVQQLMAGAQADYEAGRFAAAEEKAERAWTQRQSVDIAVTLGQIEIAQQKWPEAAEHLAHAKRIINVSESPEVRKQVDDLFELARKNSSSLVIKPNVPGCKVKVGAQSADRPVTADPIFVAPGRVTLFVSKEGYITSDHAVDAQPGVETEVLVVLEPDTTTPKSNKPVWPYVLLSGLAAAGLGAGIGLTVGAVSKASDAEDLVCAGDPDCTGGGDDAYGQANLFLGFGVGAFVVSAAALGGVIAYAAIPGGKPKNAMLLPYVTPDTAGLLLNVSF